MADFFSRLAERTLGVAPVAQADLPSTFAPAAPMEWSTETIAPRQTVPADSSNPQSKLQPRERQDLPPQGEEERISLAPREELVFRPAPLKFQPTSANDLLVAEEKNNFNFASSESRAAELGIAESRDHQPQPSLMQHPQVSPQSERAAFPDSSAFMMGRSQATSPVVQVSIGRVEVRAVTAPVQSRRMIERKAPPLLSLDQYLRERNEGKRR